MNFGSFILMHLLFTGSFSYAQLSKEECKKVATRKAFENYMNETKALGGATEEDFYQKALTTLGDGSESLFKVDAAPDSFGYLSRISPLIDSKSGAFKTRSKASSEELHGASGRPIYSSVDEVVAFPADPDHCFDGLEKTSYFPGNQRYTKVSNPKAFYSRAASSIILKKGEVNGASPDTKVGVLALRQVFLNKFSTLSREEQDAYFNLLEKNEIKKTFISDDGETGYDFIWDFDKRKKLKVNGVEKTPCLMMLAAVRDQVNLVTSNYVTSSVLSSYFDDTYTAMRPSKVDDCKKLADKLWNKLLNRGGKEYYSCDQNVQFDLSQKKVVNGKSVPVCFAIPIGKDGLVCQIARGDGTLLKATFEAGIPIVCNQATCVDPSIANLYNGYGKLAARCLNDQLEIEKSRYDTNPVSEKKAEMSGKGL